MAWQYITGPNSKEWLPSGANVKRHHNARLYYQITETATTYKIEAYGQEALYKDNCGCVIGGTLKIFSGSTAVAGPATGSKRYTYSSSASNHTGVYYTICKSASAPLSYTWTKTTSTQSGSATMVTNRDSGPSGYTSTASYSFTIPALKQYNITANGNGGEATVPSGWTDAGNNAIKTDYYNTSITLPSATRTGYTFSGWGTSSSATTASYGGGSNYKVVGTATLYAIWKINSYTLTANANGGSISSTSGWTGTGTTATKSVTYAAAYSTLPTPTRTGYNFAGWYTAASGGTAVSSSTTIGAANTTIYAHWTPITYSITYTLNGGSASNVTSYTIETANFTLTNPTRTGYNFSGWTGSNGSTASTSVTINKGSTGNKSYTANWSEKTAVLTYNKSALTNATIPANITMKYTAATTLTAGTPPSGYGFYGWATSEANAKAGTRAYTGTATYKNANVVPTAATLYAIWYGTLSYNANGHGTAPASQTMYYTAATNAAAAISATGYTFGGWNTAANGSGTTYGANAQVKAANTYKTNTVLYAKWTANTYTLTINPQSGTYNSTTSNSTKTMTYDATTNNNIGTPTRSGYTFGGWYTSTGGGGTLVFSNTGAYNNSATTYWSSGKWIYTGALTVYAKWTANNYTVTFNANGGTTPTASKTVTYASTYGTLPTPTRANHTFAGWYTAASGGSAVTASTTFSTAGNITLYAHWTGNKVGPKFVNAPLTQRATSAGAYDAENKYCIIIVKANNGYNYADASDSTTASATTVKVNYKLTTASSYSAGYLKKIKPTTASVSQTPTITQGEEATFLITNSSGTAITFDTLKTYDIQVVLTSANGLTSTTIVPLSAAIFPLDFNATGTAAGFFRVAPDAPSEGLYVGKQAVFDSTINNFNLTIPASGLNANDVKESNGLWVSAASITNAPITNHGILLGFKNVGTPFQLYMGDSTHLYVYKRSWDSTNAVWRAWDKLSAGYADSAGNVSGTIAVAHGGTGNTAQTANKLIYAQSTSKLSSVPNIAYFTGNSTASTPAKYQRLHIHGDTYGNTAATLISNTAGVFRFGDGGPQITFDTSATPGGGQAGAIIFTDHDNAGTGVSFHFVSNQNSNNNGGDLTVTAPRFRARSNLTIGQNTDNNSYALYVKGNTFNNGINYFANGTTYYINNSAVARLNYIECYNSLGININPSASVWPYIRISSRAGTSALGTGTVTYTTIDQDTWANLYYQIPGKRLTYATAGDASSSTTTYYYPAKWFFRQYSPTASGARTKFYEDYSLPNTNVDRTANAGYSILTTKSAVTVAQGGTGATTAAAALTNLGAAAASHTHNYAGSSSAGGPANVVAYTTTAPTAANSSGLKFAVLTSDPATKYNGWVYLIKG